MNALVESLRHTRTGGIRAGQRQKGDASGPGNVRGVWSRERGAFLKTASRGIRSEAQAFVAPVTAAFDGVKSRPGHHCPGLLFSSTPGNSRQLQDTVFAHRRVYSISKRHLHTDRRIPSVLPVLRSTTFLSRNHTASDGGRESMSTSSPRAFERLHAGRCPSRSVQ